MGIFKVALSPTFWAKVEVEVTAEDGRRVPVDFDLQYKRVTPDEATEIGGRLQNNGDLRNTVRELVVGWKRVAGDDGSTLDFSPENFERLLDLGFAGPILDTFLKNLPKAKQKN